MRAVDTNVLVRLITRDDMAQVAAAEEFVRSGAWASHLVIAEISWVLDAVYGLSARQIALAIEMLLNHEHITIQESDVVDAAVTSYRKRTAVSFSDCLVLEIARKAGHTPLGTFDRSLARIEGAQRL